MITAKFKTGVLAGAILTVAAISAPAAEAATTYNTDFSVFQGGIEVFDITGTVTYSGPALTTTLQDFALADANDSGILQYDWNVNAVVGSSPTFVGNFTQGNSFWESVEIPPLSGGPFPFPFQISSERFLLKSLTGGQGVGLSSNDEQAGFSVVGPTTNASGQPVSYILGKAAPIPTPALLPGLLGFGASIVRRKKKQAEAAA